MCAACESADVDLISGEEFLIATHGRSPGPDRPSPTRRWRHTDGTLPSTFGRHRARARRREHERPRPPRQRTRRRRPHRLHSTRGRRGSRCWSGSSTRTIASPRPTVPSCGSRRRAHGQPDVLARRRQDDPLEADPRRARREGPRRRARRRHRHQPRRRRVGRLRRRRVARQHQRRLRWRVPPRRRDGPLRPRDGSARPSSTSS